MIRTKATLELDFTKRERADVMLPNPYKHTGSGTYVYPWFSPTLGKMVVRVFQLKRIKDKHGNRWLTWLEQHNDYR